MEAPMNEDLTYQYYRILREDSTEGHVLQNNIISVNLSEINKSVVLLSNDPSSNESFDAANSLQQYDLGNNNMKYASLEAVGEFLETSTIDDEHFDTIEPTLLNFNHNIEGYNESQHIEEEIHTDTGFLESSDDSNTAYNNLLNSINTKTDSNSGEGTSDFKCILESCDRTYATSYHLMAHMRSHIDPKPYKCPFDSCGQCFANSSDMKTHVKIHSGEKPFICVYCSQVFKTAAEKKTHARIHTGNRPFHCTIEGCSSTFKTYNARKVHVRSHTGDRPYRCTHPGCGKAFTSSANHKSHQRIHSGEKPYACTFQGCGKRFTEYSTMYKHFTSHRKNLTRDNLQYTSDNSNIQIGNL